MAYSPISLFPPYYPVSGAVLKAYLPNTTTLLQLATDATGSTLVNDMAFNAGGFIEVSGNPIIPHVNQSFKLAIYPTQAAADADSGATVTIPSLTPTGESISVIDTVNTVIALRSFTGVSTSVKTLGNAAAGDGGHRTYRRVTGASAGTYVDNGDSIIVPSGGDGSEAWLALPFDEVLKSQIFS